MRKGSARASASASARGVPRTPDAGRAQFSSRGQVRESEVLKHNADLTAHLADRGVIVAEFDALHLDQAFVMHLETVDAAESVDFPEPDGPQITTRSPSATSRSTGQRAKSRKRLVTPECGRHPQPRPKPVRRRR